MPWSLWTALDFWDIVVVDGDAPPSRDDKAKGEACLLVADANDQLALRFRARVIIFSLLRAALEMPTSSFFVLLIF